MSFDFHSASSAEPANYDDRGLHSNWREHIVTVVATSVAVLIVAVIAVLMGMGLSARYFGAVTSAPSASNALRDSEVNCRRHITITIPVVVSASGSGPKNQPR